MSERPVQYTISSRFLKNTQAFICGGTDIKSEVPYCQTSPDSFTLQESPNKCPLSAVIPHEKPVSIAYCSQYIGAYKEFNGLCIEVPEEARSLLQEMIEGRSSNSEQKEVDPKLSEIYSLLTRRDYQVPQNQYKIMENYFRETARYIYSGLSELKTLRTENSPKYEERKVELLSRIVQVCIDNPSNLQKMRKICESEIQKYENCEGYWGEYWGKWWKETIAALVASIVGIVTATLAFLRTDRFKDAREAAQTINQTSRQEGVGWIRRQYRKGKAFLKAVMFGADKKTTTEAKPDLPVITTPVVENTSPVGPVEPTTGDILRMERNVDDVNNAARTLTLHANNWFKFDPEADQFGPTDNTDADTQALVRELNQRVSALVEASPGRAWLAELSAFVDSTLPVLFKRVAEMSLTNTVNDARTVLDPMNRDSYSDRVKTLNGHLSQINWRMSELITLVERLNGAVELIEDTAFRGNLDARLAEASGLLYVTRNIISSLAETATNYAGKPQNPMIDWLNRVLASHDLTKVKSLVELAVAINHGAADKQHVTIEIDNSVSDIAIRPRHGLPLVVTVAELIGNALEHAFSDTPGQHDIKISGRIDGDIFRLTVTDNGKGINENDVLAQAEKPNSGWNTIRTFERAGVFEVSFDHRPVFAEQIGAAITVSVNLKPASKTRPPSDSHGNSPKPNGATGPVAAPQGLSPTESRIRAESLSDAWERLSPAERAVHGAFEVWSKTEAAKAVMGDIVQEKDAREDPRRMEERNRLEIGRDIIQRGR